MTNVVLAAALVATFSQGVEAQGLVKARLSAQVFKTKVNKKGVITYKPYRQSKGTFDVTVRLFEINDSTITALLDEQGQPWAETIPVVIDRNGNQAAFTWTALGGYARQASFTDSYGRTVTYSYFGSEQDYQLKEIQDFIGRKITFQYDAGGLVGSSGLLGAGSSRTSASRRKAGLCLM